jgi:ArsR family transcriptional regulator
MRENESIMGKNETIPLTTTFTCSCDLPPSLRLNVEEAENAAAALKALGHPVRLQIVDLLSRYEGQVCVCDIESQFTLSQPTISHHLKILREAGLVGVEQRGLWGFYFVRRAALDSVRSLVASWVNTLDT